MSLKAKGPGLIKERTGAHEADTGTRFWEAGTVAAMTVWGGKDSVIVGGFAVKGWAGALNVVEPESCAEKWG
jgi:hypothetical protein